VGRSPPGATVDDSGERDDERETDDQQGDDRGQPAAVGTVLERVHPVVKPHGCVAPEVAGDVLRDPGVIGEVLRDGARHGEPFS